MTGPAVAIVESASPGNEVTHAPKEEGGPQVHRRLGLQEKMMDGTSYALLTCPFPLSGELLRDVCTFGSELRSAGLSLYCAARDPVEVDAPEVRFGLLPGRLADCGSPEYAVASTTSPPYAYRLADIDSSWGERAPDDLEIARSLSGVQGCRNIATRTLSDLRPAVALFWAAGIFPASRVWRDVAREMGIPSFSIERGLLPGTWMTDSEGMNDLSDSLVHPVVRRLLLAHNETKRLHTYRDWFNTTRPRKYGLPGGGPETLRKDLNLRGKVVCVLGGLDTGSDGNGVVSRLRSGTPGLISSLDLIDAINAAEIDPGVDVVFKAHPGSRNRIPVDTIGRVRVLDYKTDPVDLLRLADVVVAGTTTLVYEALLLHRPLVLTSVGPVTGTGLAYEAFRGKDLGPAVNLALSAGGRGGSKEVDSFLDGLLTHYLYAMTEAVPALPLRDLALHLATISPLRVGGDSRHEEAAPAQASAVFPLLVVDRESPREPGRKCARTTSCTVYFDSGQGFDEARSERRTLRLGVGIEALQFTVPRGTQGLRIDPADMPCVERLIGIRWLDAHNATIETTSARQALLPGSESQMVIRQDGDALKALDFVSTGTDPHFLCALGTRILEALRHSPATLELLFSAWEMAQGVAIRPDELLGELAATRTALLQMKTDWVAQLEHLERRIESSLAAALESKRHPEHSSPNGQPANHES